MAACVLVATAPIYWLPGLPLPVLTAVKNAAFFTAVALAVVVSGARFLQFGIAAPFIICGSTEFQRFPIEWFRRVRCLPSVHLSSANGMGVGDPVIESGPIRNPAKIPSLAIGARDGSRSLRFACKVRRCPRLSTALGRTAVAGVPALGSSPRKRLQFGIYFR